MSKHSQKIIYIVGAFPPPTHGMALINEKISILFSGYMSIKKFDISQINLSRGFAARFLRIFTISSALIKFLFSSNKFKNIFYIGLSGGYGQLYDLIFIESIHFIFERLHTLNSI